MSGLSLTQLTEGIQIAQQVSSEIEKCGIYDQDAGVLGHMVLEAWSGNYVEIGSGYGGSALTALKVKERHGLGGQVFCVDPFPSSLGRQFHGATLEAFEKNTKNHSRIVLFPSIARLLSATEETFSSCLIDGYHKEDEPVQDWIAINSRVTRFLMFHDATHYWVSRAIQYALTDNEWTHYYSGGNCVLLRRKSI